MNWIQSLYETYENCRVMIGTTTDEHQVPLLPICHTTQKAQIEIALDVKGKFRRARIISKNEARTIIPCTEKSAGRTSGEAAHPLCDKLQYLAADYSSFGGERTSYYESFVQLLSNWVTNNVPEKVCIINKYIRQGHVISDLVTSKTLTIEKDGKLCHQRPFVKEKNAQIDIFDLLPGIYNEKKKRWENWQADAFIRWKVEGVDEISEVWNDPQIISSWINYYSSTKSKKAMCYVTGKECYIADQHPAKIRNDGDKAKLIASGKSANKNGDITIDDGCGFTFLGRFTYPDQAATVSFEASQKAHFALRWLMSRQGYVAKGELGIVAWATSGAKVPQPTTDTYDELFRDLPVEESQIVHTGQEVALRLKKKIAGYSQDLGNTAQLAVMAVDSATPGRLSIIYYRMLSGSDFLERIEHWHNSCAWRHTYKSVEEQDEKGKIKKRFITFVGAPSPADIAEAAYGIRIDDKLKKATIKRLLPSIIEGRPLPRDLVESAVRRASNSEGLTGYEWSKSLSIACALFRKYMERKEKFDMALDENRTTRDYLYGRLLAIADILEERALYKAKEKRASNAMRYMHIFSQHPFRTWNQIHSALTPYMVRLGGANFYKNLMAEIKGLFHTPEEFMNDNPLSGEYLLAFYCQRQKLIEKKVNSKSEADESDGNTEN